MTKNENENKNKKTGATLRETLTAELEELEREERETSDQRRPVELDQQSVGRLSRMDAMERQAMAQATSERRARRRLRLKAAIDRIDAGDYGYCARCDEAIEAERLRLDPTHPFCSACAR